MLGEVRLPNEDTEIDARKYDDERGEAGGFGGPRPSPRPGRAAAAVVGRPGRGD
jgi:hypothetical protein